MDNGVICVFFIQTTETNPMLKCRVLNDQNNLNTLSSACFVDYIPTMQIIYGPPDITPPTDTVCPNGTTYQYVIDMSGDPNAYPLTLLVTGLPPYALLDKTVVNSPSDTKPVLSWTPVPADATGGPNSDGIWYPVWKVTDSALPNHQTIIKGSGGEYPLQVLAFIPPPVLASPGDKVVTCTSACKWFDRGHRFWGKCDGRGSCNSLCGNREKDKKWDCTKPSVLTFTLSATNGPVVYSMTGAPDGATLDPNTGVFSWTVAWVYTPPTDGDTCGTQCIGGGGWGGWDWKRHCEKEQVYTVTFTATNISPNNCGGGSDSKTITITVKWCWQFKWCWQWKWECGGRDHKWHYTYKCCWDREDHDGYCDNCRDHQEGGCR